MLIFGSFMMLPVRDPAQLLKRFHLLLAQGDKLGRQQLKWLRTVATPTSDYKSLLPALSLLEAINNCNFISKLQTPGLHVFGDRDSVVPLSAARRLTALSTQYKDHRQQCHLLKDTGHLVFWPSGRVASLIHNYLTTLFTTSRHYGN